MNQWYHFAAGICLVSGIAVCQAATTDKPADVADQVFRSGVELCNAAARLSRTDTRQARSDFDQYLDHLQRARAIDPQLLEDNTFAARESHRCSQTGDDIARAEALPVMEKAITQCQDARVALRKGDSDVARARYNLYLLNRDRAIQKTSTVLKVGSLALQVRHCDDLPDRIAALEAGQQKQITLAKARSEARARVAAAQASVPSAITPAQDMPAPAAAESVPAGTISGAALVQTTSPDL